MQIDTYLPSDQYTGTLIGRAWVPQSSDFPIAGPTPIWLHDSNVYDISSIAPTCSEILNIGISKKQLEAGNFRSLGSVAALYANSIQHPLDKNYLHLLSPFDLQAIKACGVTFVSSMLERVIEEKAEGNADVAKGIRQKIYDTIGSSVNNLVPGSTEALALKEILIKENMWSQYLEVGIGPYAEVFTKSQPLSSVGLGAQVGLHPISSWNNPEPEIVLAVNNQGKIVGSTIGNDVNLRDVEGRSALLLGKAKDNNASCSIGPIIRLFDDSYSLDDVRSSLVTLNVKGAQDEYELDATNDMVQISRDVEDLVSQTISDCHQYPDGLALFTGTLFTPTQDRGEAGKGFTHKTGDIVSISTKHIGTLQNTVDFSNQIAPWEFGISALMKNLAQRNLI
ncbi:fumarylacetoacetate hydrolase family protein [Paraglaciecola aquimarina]|uniref:Fumarylacetoacetate hydrolase family protein n=1 Tax=Paraglaciecola algarum TaxID=3050085 RepID=A0ABS9D3H4_9ALTE|nr:fumarylacetoacetate hydrolase family protein [Paraglaciecola sp. G1-23]MCF2947487.1 fumarylacetoacetate hydrolase family protein [Paraglaciecola sp. G1-23]